MRASSTARHDSNAQAAHAASAFLPISKEVSYEGLPADDGGLEEDLPALSIGRSDVEHLLSGGIAPRTLVARFPDIAQAPEHDIPGWGLALIRRTNPRPGTARYLFVPGGGMVHVQPLHGGETLEIHRVERYAGRAYHQRLDAGDPLVASVLATYARVDELLGGAPGLVPAPKALSVTQAPIEIGSSAHVPVVSVRRRRLVAS